jgi:AcrR family transcriptional regulator
VNAPSPVSRREREKQQRHQAILDAAERVFARHGFHGASMNQIAQEAELAPGTLYLYFKDKASLYKDLFRSKLGAMIEEIEKAAKAGSDPLESLRNSVRAQMEFNDRNQEFFEVVSRHRPAEQSDNDREWEAAHTTMNRHHAALTRLIQQAQRKKLIRPGDSRSYAMTLMGAAMHTSHELALAHAPLCDEPEFIFNLFLNGARNPVAHE